MIFGLNFKPQFSSFAILKNFNVIKSLKLNRGGKDRKGFQKTFTGYNYVSMKS